MHFRSGGDPEVVFGDGSSFSFKFKANFRILFGRFRVNRDQCALIKKVSEYGEVVIAF